MTHVDMDRIVERVGDLPAMPSVVSDALNLTDDPESDMEAVAAILERDPGLSARILRVSNSPYFGMRQHVGTLKLALVILGVREVRNIILGVSLVDSLRDEKTDQLLTNRFWQDSFRVGSLSKRVGKTFSLGCQGEDFIAGLLHGIGKMVLCRHLFEDYSPMFKAADNDDVLAERERAAFGFTHADISAALGKRWNLPEPLCDAIGLHLPHPDCPLANAKDPRLAAAVRIAYYTGRDSTQPPEESVAQALAQHEAWSVLTGKTGADLDQSCRESLLDIAREVSEIPPLEFG